MNDRTSSTIEPSVSVHSNPMLAYENSKQYMNNPLKDISNQVGNSGAKIQTPATLTNMKYNGGNGGGRYSMMPFEIAPKRLAIQVDCSFN
jgi:hypothetical protein